MESCLAYKRANRRTRASERDRICCLIYSQWSKTTNRRPSTQILLLIMTTTTLHRRLSRVRLRQKRCQCRHRGWHTGQGIRSTYQGLQDQIVARGHSKRLDWANQGVFLRLDRGPDPVRKCQDKGAGKVVALVRDVALRVHSHHQGVNAMRVWKVVDTGVEAILMMWLHDIQWFNYKHQT